MSSSDSGYERDGLEASIQVSSIRVEYYRSVEYSLKWETHMYLLRSSSVPNTSEESPQRSPSPNKDVIQRRLRVKRRRTGLRRPKADNNIIKTHKGRYCDIIDLIDTTNDDERTAEEDEHGEFAQLVDEGLDKSDEDFESSIASGPSFEDSAAAKTPRASQDVCSACWKLYQRAKKTKAPKKTKVVDNDPTSLKCDQWVLIKNRRPRRLPDTKGKLLTCVKLVKKRLHVKNDANQDEPSACWRPHTFLQRNLRQCVRVSVKKDGRKNRRKRTRDDCQGPRVAKQKRLQSSDRSQLISTDSTDCPDDNGCIYSPSGHSAAPTFEECNEQQMGDPGHTHLTVELVPSKVTFEQTTKPIEVPPKQKAPKKTGGFRDLLTQMRGNCSKIVRETCLPGDA